MRVAIPALIVFALFAGFSILLVAGTVRAQERSSSPLEGVWTLVAAEVRHGDGSVGRDYGVAPAGRLMIDAGGRYALQIFDTTRPRFLSGDKRNGTVDEYRDAVMGESTHYGMLDVDQVAGTLTFHIEQASYPNWTATIQQRRFELEDHQLTYRVPARPNGDVPISVWRRVTGG